MEEVEKQKTIRKKAEKEQIEKKQRLALEDITESSVIQTKT